MHKHINCHKWNADRNILKPHGYSYVNILVNKWAHYIRPHDWHAETTVVYRFGYCGGRYIYVPTQNGPFFFNTVIHSNGLSEPLVSQRSPLFVRLHELTGYQVVSKWVIILIPSAKRLHYALAICFQDMHLTQRSSFIERYLVSLWVLCDHVLEFGIPVGLFTSQVLGICMGPNFWLAVGTPQNSGVGGRGRVLINAMIYVFCKFHCWDTKRIYDIYNNHVLCINALDMVPEPYLKGLRRNV